MATTVTPQSHHASSSYSSHFRPAILVSIVLLALGLSMLSGCGGPKKSGEGDYNSLDNKSCIPSALKYVARDNGVFLQWRPNCGASGAGRGYQFYIVPDSEVTSNFPNDVTESHNSAIYPGDTNPEQALETVSLSSLLNGVSYTAVVRNVASDGAESKPSNVIHFTPMPSGELTLQVRYKGDNDGFDFASATVQRADDALNDLYFASSGKGDFLASPSKLSFGLKSTRFQKIGAFSSMLDAAGAKPQGSKSDEIKIEVGDLIEILTENNHFVRIRVVEFSGNDKERTVKLEYLYQTTEAVSNF